MNILIVDDHAVVREGYKALLNAMMPDCRIFDAENGAQTHRLKSGKIWSGTYLRDYWELGKKFGT